MGKFARYFGIASAVLFAVGSAVTGRAQPVGPVAVDVELVLAVDISMSMDPDEQRLQRDGYIAAFRDADVIAAIGKGRRRRIAVTYVEWAGPLSQAIVVPWRLIDGRTSAEAFTTELANQPIQRRSRTSISSVLTFVTELFGTGGFRAPRQVIDVSGDGVNNSGPLLSLVRAKVLDAGIVINGLPILVRPTTSWTAWDAPDLDLYYATCVIGGLGSFSIPILKNEDFVTATRKKILLEIAGLSPPAGGIVRVADTAAPKVGYDCREVERRLQGGGGGD